MVVLAEWLRDWRRIADEMEDGVYEVITATHDDVTFEIARVSLYDREIDEDKRFVSTTSKDFEGSTASMTRRTAEMGVARVVTTKGKEWFILEQGDEALAWVAAAEGVTMDTFVSVVRSGAVGRRIARRVAKREKELRASLEARVSELTEFLIDLDHEKASAELEMNRLKRHMALRLSRS